MNRPFSRSSRRAFLTGRAAADALNERLAHSDEPTALPDLVRRPYLLHFSRRAMACEFEVCFHAGQYPQGPQVAIEALDRIEQLEAMMTVFRPTSQLMEVNRLAAERAVEVDDALYALLELAERIYHDTEGAWDVTTGPLTKVWGFHQRAGRVPDAESLREALEVVGFCHVRLDPRHRTVRFTRHGVELNLGSIGKGYALDQAAELLEAAGVHDFVWHGGQSSVLARGNATPELGKQTAAVGAEAIVSAGRPDAPGSQAESSGESDDVTARQREVCEGNARDLTGQARKEKGGEGGEASDRESLGLGEGWWIGIRDPLRPKRRLARIRLRNQALATSGSRVQFFRHKGRRYGHILDPRTGQPAEGVLSVTAVAPTAAWADALSTAFYVMGPEAARRYVEKHPEVGAVVVTQGRSDDSTGPLRTAVINLDSDCLRWEAEAASEQVPE